MHPEQRDFVDVSVSSHSPVVDAILDHPLLDGSRQYTVEVTEFSASLGGETPLPPYEEFANSSNELNSQSRSILQVRRRVTGQAPLVAATLLSTGHSPRLEPFQYFSHTKEYPVSTVHDLVFWLQHYFDNIKAIYSRDDVSGLAHAGGPDEDAFETDDWVSVTLSPNGTLRVQLSRMFSQYFFIYLTPFGKSVLGFSDDYISFSELNGEILGGTNSLLSNDPIRVILAGDPDESAIAVAEFPVTRGFEHRVAITLDSGGMPVPATVSWLTTNKQSVRHTLATFPITQTYSTSVHIDTDGSTASDVTFSSQLQQGCVVFRRAEDKVSQRFPITNSRFFQNLRLEVWIERRLYDFVANTGYTFKRMKMKFTTGDYWTAKLRFKSVK